MYIFKLLGKVMCVELCKCVLHVLLSKFMCVKMSQYILHVKDNYLIVKQFTNFKKKVGNIYCLDCT